MGRLFHENDAQLFFFFNSDKYYSGVAYQKKKMSNLELDFDGTLLYLESTKHYRELVHRQHLKGSCIPGRNL